MRFLTLYEIAILTSALGASLGWNKWSGFSARQRHVEPQIRFRWDHLSWHRTSFSSAGACTAVLERFFSALLM